MTRVRLFADRDYPAYVRIKRLAEQRDISVAEARDQDGRWDHSRYERIRVVAVDEEDAPVGYGEIYHEPTRLDYLPSVICPVEGPAHDAGHGSGGSDRLFADPHGPCFPPGRHRTVPGLPLPACMVGMAIRPANGSSRTGVGHRSHVSWRP